jgi:hypothetical protein
LSRARTFSIFAALIALTAALAACGGGGSDDPRSVLDDATLQGIDSGKVDLAVAVDLKGKEGGDIDVNPSGPFRSQEGQSPELDLAFSMDGNVKGKEIDRRAGFTLLGNKAYVGYEGVEYAVDRTTFDFAKSIIDQQSNKGQGENSGCQEALGDLDLSDYIENPKDEGSADVGGTETTKISGSVDDTATVDTLDEILEEPACEEQLEAAGSGSGQAEIDEIRNFARKSLKSAHSEIFVGDDDIVRRLVLDMKFDAPQGSSGPDSFDIAVDLTLTDVNEEVTVTAPRNTKPLSALFIKLGINPLELLEAFQGGNGGQGLGSLLEKLAGAGGDSGGGRGSYYECIGEASTPVDIQSCTGLLQ